MMRILRDIIGVRDDDAHVRDVWQAAEEFPPQPEHAEHLQAIDK